jgi:iron complex outermembrane recepter protein
MNNTQRGWWCALPLAACASAPAIGADKTAEKEPGETLVVVGQASAKGVQSYQPLTSVTATRTETSLLNVPQAIDVVPRAGAYRSGGQQPG